jgi:hypothetical protein
MTKYFLTAIDPIGGNMFEKPNQPVGGFRMTDSLPDRQMTVAELVRFQGSRFVLAALPRRNPFGPDGMGFSPGQRVHVYWGALIRRSTYYVAPPNQFSYRFIGECVAFLFSRTLLGVYMNGSPHLFPLDEYFALDAALCEQVLGTSSAARFVRSFAPTYPTKSSDRK